MIKLLDFLSIKSLKTLIIFFNGFKNFLFYSMAILIAFSFSYHWSIIIIALFGVIFGIISDINKEFLKKYHKIFIFFVLSGIPFYTIIAFTIISIDISKFFVFLIVSCFIFNVFRKYLSSKLVQILNLILKETASIKKRFEENTINIETASVLINNQSKKLQLSTKTLVLILGIFTYAEVIILFSSLIYVFSFTNISGKTILFCIFLFFIILIINYYISKISKLIISKQI